MSELDYLVGAVFLLVIVAFLYLLVSFPRVFLCLFISLLMDAVVTMVCLLLFGDQLGAGVPSFLF